METYKSKSDLHTILDTAHFPITTCSNLTRAEPMFTYEECEAWEGKWNKQGSQPGSGKLKMRFSQKRAAVSKRA